MSNRFLFLRVLWESLWRLFWTKPWTAIVPLQATQGPFFEYACSESNMDVVNILAGARATERAAEEKAKRALGNPDFAALSILNCAAVFLSAVSASVHSEIATRQLKKSNRFDMVESGRANR